MYAARPLDLSGAHRVNLVLLSEPELVDGAVALEGERAEHLLDVLRVKVGDTVRVGVVDGDRGRGEVIAIEGRTVRLACVLDAPMLPEPRLDVLLALPRPKVLARLYSPLAQLGVARVLLTNAWRVERYYFDSHVLAPEAIREGLLEGLAQAKDTRVPRVSVHRSLKFLLDRELAELVPEGTRLVVADPGAEVSLRDALAGAPRALVAIGPEGGWTDRERRMLDERRFTRVGMGARTLRSDVATIALCSLAHDALGTPARDAPG